MERNVSRGVRFGAGLVGLITIGWILSGQAAKPALEGLPTDWTHRHVIFSRPETSQESRRVAGDVRYWQQWYRQHIARAVSPDAEASAIGNRSHSGTVARSEIKRDWSETLGANGTVGAGAFPAKYSFGINTANCANATTPDFAVFSTGPAGLGTQASIVAYDNLYAGCPTTTVPVPSVYWAYNTGGEILTSPIFSRDGSQIAIVQTNGTAASLVLLKWAASTTESVGSPLTLTAVTSPSLYPSCTAPCMITIPLVSGGAPADDEASSVYYDYIGDTAWVGDANGYLHQFTPVFNGTTTTPPAEVANTTWPVLVSSTATALTSPVHDTVSGNVFVEDQGGFLYSVGASTGTVVTSGELDYGVPAANDGPILDRTAEMVYVFSSSDGSTSCSGTACSAVYQLAATFADGDTGTEVTLGTAGPTPKPMYDGSFDHEFYSSPTRTGNLYVCGDTGLDPVLYQVPIAAGTPGTALSLAGPTPFGTNPACSPVTDVLNPTAAGGAPEERVFLSVTDSGLPTACGASGCALSFISMPWLATTAYQVGQNILIYRNLNHTFYTNVAVAAGTSGGTAPAWPVDAGTVTSDGSVSWLNQGAAEFTVMGAWAAGHTYRKGNRIFDGTNIEAAVTVVGTSGGSVPSWPAALGATTTDGTVTWINAGPLPSAALQALGGTSGIIIDNTVSTATLAGTSELYFSTLSPENCPTAPASGCAVQASQSALK